tara:strand:- start:193 stop:810 length:618 start_codon:yes stop_codon:yes gene_type:complete
MKPRFWNKGKLYLSKKDEVLKLIIKNYDKEYLSTNNNYFHSLINSIIGQQISVKAASSIKNKFFLLNNNITPVFIRNTKIYNLKKIGLSKQKISYIKNISNFFIENKKFIKNISNFDEKIIRDELINIKGVGPWTIDMFLMFSLGKPNIFPIGDLGLQKSISLFYKKKLPLSENFLNNLYEIWSPYSTIATWYMWRSLDPIPVNY